MASNPAFDPTANDLIDQIGAKVVREHFQLSPQALHMWKRRGIPHLKRIAFQNLALAHGVSTPGDFLKPLGIAA